MKTQFRLSLGLILGALVLPAFTNGAQTVTNIAAGYRHSLFLKSDGSLWAMGVNLAGQLGDGTLIGTNRPEQIVATNVTAIAGGAAYSLFLQNDGSLWSMGASPAIGDGIDTGTNRAKQIVASNVTAIAAGGSHSLFLKTDGSLWAVGYNYYGQLGDGTYGVYPFPYTTQPEQIVASNVTAIAAGDNHSLFLKSDGSLWGMGANGYGQLGDGTTDSGNYSTNQPEQIVASNVTAIAAGFYHSLFLKSDGSLWAMGDNYYGQLGDGSYNNTDLPKEIVASNVTAIAAGGYYSLFLKSDDSLWAMGDNTYGQLGDGTTDSGNYVTNQPEEIVASNVTAIAASGWHNLFLKSDGSLWGMGRNAYGEVGLGAPNIPEVHIPVQIVPLAIPLSLYGFYNYVGDGGFETEAFSNWDLSGNISSDTLVSPKTGYVHSGSYGAQCGPVGSLVYLSQTLSTTPGGRYLLSFWLNSPDGETPNEFLVSWNGATLLDKTNLAAIGWTNLQFAVTAAGTSTVLQFGFRDDNTYLGLDDISVVRMVQPASTGISLSGTNLVINGKNGLYGVSYRTLVSTNLAQPRNQWTPVATNVLDADGNFTITLTNAVNPTVPRRYYILQLQ